MKSLSAKKIRTTDGLISLSGLSGKLAGVDGLTTSPNNPGCKARAKIKGSICSKCYAMATLKQYKQCENAWQENARILSLPLSDASIEKIALGLRAKSGLVRFESHGDVISRQQVVNYFRIACRRPDLKFAIWSKVPALFNGLVAPSNLVCILSTLFIDAAPKSLPAPFHKSFTVLSEDSDKINCGARNCATCRVCYSRDTTSELFELAK